MRLIFLLFIFFIFEKNIAQTPFECGSAYFTSGDNNGCDIYKVIQNTNGILSASFLVKTDRGFNGVGYRRQDNFMYATASNANSDRTFNFYQIGANGKTKLLRTLPLNSSCNYYSGDVTVDGKYYVALANDCVPNKLYLVDLTDPAYPIKELPFPGNTTINSPDIAFNPEGTRLFAYSRTSKELIEIDYINAKVIKRYPNTSSINDNYSGMWSFDCALFGYSRQYVGFLRSELEGKKDSIGTMKEVGKFTPANNGAIDGCSCPPPVKFFKHSKKTVNPDTCITEIKFYFTVDNNCGIQQNNILFKDLLPQEFIITKIDKNPFGGAIKQGIGSSTLLIENMTIPNRRDTMVITTRLQPTIDKQFYKNQAFLENIRHQDGLPITIQSDDPFTPDYLDSTIVKAPLFVKFSRDTIGLCPNGAAKLKPKIEGDNVTYKWSTGETTELIEVKKAGIYSVTVTSDCEIKIDTQVVVNEPITLNIGPDYEVLPGDSVFIFPQVGGFNPVETFNWIPSKGSNLKDKKLFDNISKPNEEDVTIGLVVKDDLGCQAMDFMRITMRRNLFIPNTFSPNDNNDNDQFYIFTEARAQVASFEIFDRWGNMVFSISDCPTNDSLCGWDGTFRGKKAEIGVYTFVANILFLDGVKVLKKGDVMLVR